MGLISLWLDACTTKINEMVNDISIQLRTSEAM